MRTKCSGHLPPGTAEIQGHRTVTQERQEPITDNKTMYNHKQQDGQRKAKGLTREKPRQPGNTRTELSHHSKQIMPNTQEKEDSDPKSYPYGRVPVSLNQLGAGWALSGRLSQTSLHPGYSQCSLTMPVSLDLSCSWWQMA